jgi:hypothetical protein
MGQIPAQHIEELPIYTGEATNVGSNVASSSRSYDMPPVAQYNPVTESIPTAEASPVYPGPPDVVSHIVDASPVYPGPSGSSSSPAAVEVQTQQSPKDAQSDLPPSY